MTVEIHLKTKNICVPLASIFTSHWPKEGLSTLSWLFTVI